MTDRYTQIAEDLLPLLGGPQNIAGIENCITRLRITPRDATLIRTSDVAAVAGVLGVVEGSSSYQVVLGPGTVEKVAAALSALAAQEEAGPATPPAGAAGPVEAATLAARGAAMKADRAVRNDTPVKNLIRRIANIFVPLIPGLIGAGLILAIRGLLANWAVAGAPGWVAAAVPALTAIGSAFYAYLAIFAGMNAAKEVGGTPVLGGAVGAIIVVPAVAAVTYSAPVIGEVTLSPGQGGVLGAVGAAAVCAWIERSLRGRIPDAIDILVTPTVALLGSGLATVFVLMPVAEQISQAIAGAALWLMTASGILAGLVLGGLFLPVVMLGLHQALIPIHTTLIEQVGFTPLLTILAMAGAGQVGAALAVYLRARSNRPLRDTIKGALPVGLLGVGEPLIYGVTLPLGRPFSTACIGGALGGATAGAFNQLIAPFGATAIGPSGWALLPLLQSDHGQGYAMVAYVSGLLVGYVSGFAVTWLWGIPPDLAGEHPPGFATSHEQRPAPDVDRSR